MYWLNLLVALLVGLGLLALLALTTADLLGLFGGRRWRGPAAPISSGTPMAEKSLAPLPVEPEEPPLAWLLYQRGGEKVHRQPLPAEGSAFIGRQAFAGLDRDIALRALEVSWRDGMPAVRSLDPSCPAEMRQEGDPLPLELQAGADWEPWPETAEIRVGGCALRWQEAAP